MEDKNNSIIKIKDKKDVSFLLKCCIFLSWVFPAMSFGGQYNAKAGYNIPLWVIECVLIIGLTVWGIKLNNINNQDFKPEKFALYFGVSGLFFSLNFFWMFYTQIYKIALIDSPMYLILGIAGYIVVICAVLYYRYMYIKVLLKTGGEVRIIQ